MMERHGELREICLYHSYCYLYIGHFNTLVIHDALFHFLDQHLLAVGEGTLELLREALYPPHFVATVFELRNSSPHFVCLPLYSIPDNAADLMVLYVHFPFCASLIEHPSASHAACTTVLLVQKKLQALY